MAAAKALKRIRKAFPSNFGLWVHASTTLATLAADGHCGWEYADRAFRETHNKHKGDENSVRSAALVKTQLMQFHEALALFEKVIAVR